MAEETERIRIMKGRQAVDYYRNVAHPKLYEGGWRSEIPAEHTPIIEDMLKKLKRSGFSSIDNFFRANADYNARQVGFKDYEDFEMNATEQHRKTFDGLWC